MQCNVVVLCLCAIVLFLNSRWSFKLCFTNHTMHQEGDTRCSGELLEWNRIHKLHGVRENHMASSILK